SDPLFAMLAVLEARKPLLPAFLRGLSEGQGLLARSPLLLQGIQPITDLAAHFGGAVASLSQRDLWIGAKTNVAALPVRHADAASPGARAAVTHIEQQAIAD